MATAGEPGRRVGDVVGGRYRLVGLLGNGGMSVVWKAHDEVLDRPVAVKMLSQPGTGSFRMQLREEARAYGRLNSPRIAQVHDYGEAEDGAPYLVMEYVTGLSLSERLAGNAALPWPAAVSMTAQIAEALRDVHAHGLVHRDVKPDNVMLTNSGAKLVDFGICAMIGAPDADANGTLLGTPAYVSPERIVDTPVSAAADVYGLGVLLFRSLTGELPWPADTCTGQLKAHMFATPPPLPDIDGLPPEVARICAACMYKDPQERPSSADVAHTLWLVTLAHGIPASDVVALATPTSPAPATRGAAAPTSPPPTRHHADPGPTPAAAFAAVTSNAFGGGTGNAAAHSGSDTVSPTQAIAAPAGLLVAAAGHANQAIRSATRVMHIRHPESQGPRRRYAFPAAVVVLSLALLGLAWGVLGSGHDGAAPASASKPSCMAAFTVDSDAGTSFSGLVTVTNVSAEALRGWQLSFAFPGNQAISNRSGAGAPNAVTVMPTVGKPYPAAIEQSGVNVIARAASASLASSESVTVPIFARYTGTNALPATVALNGTNCATQGSNAAPPTTPTTTPAAPPAVNSNRGHDNSGDGGHDHHHGHGHGGDGEGG